MPPAGLGTPLSDVLVVDLTRLLPGGLATQTLADLGARVVKVEQPGEGDYARWIPPLVDSEAGEVGFAFAALNRGKESVTLDLKSSAGREAALALVAEADVVVESFRPGVADRLGVGYEDARSVSPAIVYGSLSGYGANGPLAGAPNHDVNVQALAGILHQTGPPERPVVPAAQVGDMTGGLALALGVVAALREAEATGEGCWLDMSLYDAARLVFQPHVLRAEATGDPARGRVDLAGGMACYNVYEAADGEWVALGALEPKFWHAFVEAVDRLDLADRGHDVDDANAREEVAEVLRERDASAWVELLQDAGVPVTRVLPPSEVDQHPQARARGTAAPWHPGEDVAGAVPALGEHTEAVLREVGVAEDVVEAVLEGGDG